MADSLVLTGVKDIKKHTGTEMLRLNPKHGGDTFHLKRWWVEGGISTVYVDATVFDVTTGAGTVKLALATSMSTNVRIDHDGSFNFTFIGVNELSRAALFTDTFELIEHYVFPSISGGKVMTVTPPDGASRPSGSTPTPPSPPATSIGTVTVTGNSSPSDGDTEVYTASIAGSAGNLSYAWSVTGSGTINGSSTESSVTIDWSGASASVVTCVVTSGDAGVTDSPATGTLGGVTPASAAPSASPVAVEGYYPLYTTEADANAAGDGSSHSHTFSGVTYYMPNGVTYYHGDYNSGGGGY